MEAPTKKRPALNDPYRPKYHFSSEKNWMNDPNGMVYYQGEYHLFYQHHPDGMVWGPMHWGHAVSRDMINWEHLPIALYPDENGMIFSGSAVIDFENTAGFGREAMVAVFTHHNPKTNYQCQSLAFSLDKGRSWQKYANNPVLHPAPGLENFRDPKVFWFQPPGEEGHWVMCLATGYAIRFYTSENLINWKLSGLFGDGFGARAGVWETPELFKLPLQNGKKDYWILSVGVLEGGPAGGSSTQYFVGNFDGYNFSVTYDKELVHWADYGADFYAVQSWTNMPDGRRVWLAWMNNWMYGNDVPTQKWRGIMTIPRELGLIQSEGAFRLTQQPVSELKSIRGRRHEWNQFIVDEMEGYSPPVGGVCLEILVQFEIPDNQRLDCFGIRVRTGNGKFTAVGYKPNSQSLYVDRCLSAHEPFHDGFNSVHRATFSPEDDQIRLHLLLDRSSLEIFANDGQVCYTELIFPDPDSKGVELFAEGGSVVVRCLEIYEL